MRAQRISRVRRSCNSGSMVAAVLAVEAVGRDCSTR